MSSTANARRVDYLSVRKRSSMDDMIATVDKPPGSVPLNGAPIWPFVPLGAKLPVPERIPEGLVEFSRNKVGVDLWKTKDKLDFSIFDPNGYEFRSEYDPLHDPNLSHFFKNNMCTIERLQQLGFITPTYGASCTLKQFNEYRRFLNRIHQFYVERKRKRIAEKIFLANLLANADMYNKKENERSKRQAQIDIMRQNAKRRLNKLAEERRVRQAERERRSAYATQLLVNRQLKQQQNALAAAKFQTLKIARMQLMSTELQRQREVDNKIRRNLRERRYREKKLNKLKEKKFWETMRTNVRWETMVERQIRRMEYEKRLLEKQKIMFDFNVNVRKRMIEAQRRWFDKKFGRKHIKTCFCRDEEDYTKKRKRKSSTLPSDDDDDDTDVSSYEEESDFYKNTDGGDDDDDDDNGDQDAGNANKKDSDEEDEIRDLEDREEIVQSVIGVYVKRNVRQLLRDVQKKQTQLLQTPTHPYTTPDYDGDLFNPQQGTSSNKNTKNKNFQVYRVTQLKPILSKPLKPGEKRMRANDKGFSRSVSFGNVISVGTGSMYVEPGKDLRRTKDRPPTPVTSLETLAAAVSSVPWNPLLPITDLLLRRRSSGQDSSSTPTSRMSSVFMPRRKRSKYRASSVNLNNKSQRRHGITCAPDDMYGTYFDEEFLRDERYSDGSSMANINNEDELSIITEESYNRMFELKSAQPYAARKSFAERETMLDEESRENGFLQLRTEGSQAALSSILSEAEGLLLDITLDRVRRKLGALVRERLENGLDLHTKKLFRDFANQNKMFIMASATTNLTDAIMRLDARDILDAVELRYAADAIIYEMLGSEKCAVLAQEPDSQGHDLISLLNQTEIEQGKMREALGQHELIQLEKINRNRPKEIVNPPKLAGKLKIKFNTKKITKSAKRALKKVRSARKKLKRAVESGKAITKVAVPEKAKENELESPAKVESAVIPSTTLMKDAIISEKDKPTDEKEKLITHLPQKDKLIKAKLITTNLVQKASITNLNELSKLNKLNWMNNITKNRKRKAQKKGKDQKPADSQMEQIKSLQETKGKVTKRKLKSRRIDVRKSLMNKSKEIKLSDDNKIGVKKSESRKSVEAENLTDLKPIVDESLPRNELVEQQRSEEVVKPAETKEEGKKVIRFRSKFFQRTVRENRNDRRKRMKEQIVADISRLIEKNDIENDDSTADSKAFNKFTMSQNLIRRIITDAVKVSGEKNMRQKN